MTEIYALLTTRRARAGAQLGALLVVAIAVALASLDDAAARAVAALLLGGLALVSLKLGLVALQRHHQHQQPRPVMAVDGATSGELVTLRSEVDQIRLRISDVVEQVDRLASSVDPLVDEISHQRGLSRRTEPAIAEFSTLRHEVLYLREAVDRLRVDSES